MVFGVAPRGHDRGLTPSLETNRVLVGAVQDYRRGVVVQFIDVDVETLHRAQDQRVQQGRAVRVEQREQRTTHSVVVQQFELRGRETHQARVEG